MAHQPRIVPGGGIITEIKNPDVSQAFYGNLKGSPHLYRMLLESPLGLYLNILVPDLPGVKKDVSVEVMRGGRVVYSIEGRGARWSRFYEEFGGDYYYKGPELRAGLQPGLYMLEVSSASGSGRYVLVVGEREEFPPREILNVLRAMPKIKRDFFGKSPFTAFFNRIGLYLFISLAAAALFLVAVLVILRRFRRSRREAKPASY